VCVCVCVCVCVYMCAFVCVRVRVRVSCLGGVFGAEEVEAVLSLYQFSEHFDNTVHAYRTLQNQAIKA
jgi:hypothetical protein